MIKFGGYPSPSKGFSLVEVIVMISLIAIVLVPVATLFPTSVLSLKKTECRQTAIYLAKEYLEETRTRELPKLLPDNLPPDNLPIIEESYTRQLNGATFTIIRRVWAINGRIDQPPSLVDVAVEVNYPMATVPVTISTRFFKAQTQEEEK